MADQSFAAPRLGFRLNRRTLAAGLVALTAWPGAARAEPSEVKVGMVVPLSGPWARQGQLIRLGAEMAIEEINAGGGLGALGGAKMRLVAVDAGDSTEKAKNAAQRLVSQEPNLTAGVGAWLSSFTLAVTEVTERAQIPWFTLSYADHINDRGFRSVFQMSPNSSRMAAGTLPAIVELAERATGRKPATVAIIGDNTASSLGFTNPVRQGGAAQLGLKIVFDETFTPPLSDATPLVQKLRSARPDFLLMVSSNVPDNKLILEKMNEFRLGKGVIPVVGNSGSLATPELLKAAGKDVLEGLLNSLGAAELKGQEALVKRFKERTGEPWMTQDSLNGYGDMWVIKEAVEKAGSADRVKVGEAVRKLDLTEGPAALAFAGPVKFDEKGRRSGAPLVVIQWQDGLPQTVYPVDRATAQPRWPKS